MQDRDRGPQRRGRRRGGPAARRLDLPGRLVGALGVEVRDRDLASLGGERERVGLAEAPRPARDQRDPVANAQVHPYLPLKLGSRLAKKAWIPSEASSVLSAFKNARTSISLALSIGASSPSSTTSMIRRVAIGGAMGRCRPQRPWMVCGLPLLCRP